MGAGPGADIVVQGTGVEAVHCYIDNHQGVVTLVPVGEMTSVDNLTASLPTRLTQGKLYTIQSNQHSVCHTKRYLVFSKHFLFDR